MPTVSSLHIYPIKSLGEITLNLSEIESIGLKNDRRWMLIDSNGKFLTQREDGRLAQFKLSSVEGGFRVTLDGFGTYDFPLESGGPEVMATVWRDTVSAILLEDATAFFSEALGQPARLVKMADDRVRPMASEFDQAGDHNSFADGAPILVTSIESLEFLNAQLLEPVIMRRFRPNIVISGVTPYAEDDFRSIAGDGFEIGFRKRCGRCRVTTLDPDTGESAGTEPMTTLAKLRLFDGNACFGSHYTPRHPGPIWVGEPLRCS